MLTQQPQQRVPKTGAERQRTFRQRRADRVAAMEGECARLRGEAEAVRGELTVARAALADALAELERLAVSSCRHPAAAVDAGVCRECGSEVW